MPWQVQVKPETAGSLGLRSPEVRDGDGKPTLRRQDTVNLQKRRERVPQVFEHVPQCHQLEMTVREPAVFQVLVKDVGEGMFLWGRPFQPVRFKARLTGHADESSAPAANIEHACSGSEQ